MLTLKIAVTNKKRLNLKLRSKMTPAQLKANDIATSDGASIWLSSLPSKHEKFLTN